MLGSESVSNCRTVKQVQFCIRSDFDTAIELEIENLSSEKVTLWHTFDVGTAAITFLDKENRMIGTGPWEGTPPPDLVLTAVEPNELIPVRFLPSNWPDLTTLSAVGRICYRTRLYAEQSTDFGTLVRLCVDQDI